MDTSERNMYIMYIHNNIDELKISFRTEILQIILYSAIAEDKIVEKGSGTQVKYSDLDISLLKNIYNFISKKIELSTDII